MRYLIPVVLFCSLSGAALADQPVAQLPAGAAEVQIMGTTYWKSGDNFYRFNQQTGNFYLTNPPTAMPHDRSAHMYQRGQTLPATNLSSDQIEGCRNAAADKSNAVPNRGSEVFINAYNACVRDLQR